MAQEIGKIGIIGAGAWGSALAVLSAQADHDTLLWAHEAELAEAINKTHENKPYLPDIALPPAIRATAKLEDMGDRDMVLMVTPAQYLGGVLARLAPHLGADVPVVLCAKGIENDSLRFMSQLAADHIAAARIAVLSGPSFAIDVAAGQPTAVTLAADSHALAQKCAEALSVPHFRAYPSTDMLGAEIGGAVKNVLAIACGIVQGKNFGQSARAALTARGFAEMTRLGAALGAKPQSFGGLAGLGDLILTCSSPTSRNFSLGVALGEGQAAEDILRQRNTVSEGASSAAALRKLASQHGIDMPICFAVADILAGNTDVDAAIMQLLTRPVISEG